MRFPEDAYWYHLAYIVAAVIYGGYAVSLWWRRRRWQKKESSL